MIRFVVKFYLSSYHLCDQPERLSAFEAKNNRVAVVQNALNAYTDLERRERGLQREFADLKAIGLVPEELDLRQFFSRAAELQKYIEGFGYLWVTGGNAFVLRRAFSLSGLDSILQNKLDEDGFVYSGYSAGICVLAPTLKGIHIADEPHAMPKGYSPEIIWSGLGFIPYCIAPHYRSNHSESPLIEKAIEFFIEQKIPFVALRDGEALVLDSKIPLSF
jgi:dipeptidase E